MSARRGSLFVYKITRDYGFAPNPFHGYCTLATCKPKIRKAAQVGDWVVGCGSCAQGSPYRHKVIYAMEVGQKMTFDEYWNDETFANKKPCLDGSLMWTFGDNIYHYDKITEELVQVDSHHSKDNGERNDKNYKRDTSVDAVLISQNYWYWGREAQPLPRSLEKLGDPGRDHRRYRCPEDKSIIESLERWLSSFDEKGWIGNPARFDRGFERYGGE